MALATFFSPSSSSRSVSSVWRRLCSVMSAWAYAAEDGRDLRIDLLRGLAVLAMVIDHLAGPSKLYLLTGGNRFYTSAAEGFIFLSGLTVGLVYRRIAEREGLSTAMRRLLARSWTLYVLAVGLTLVLLPLSESLQLPWAVGIDQGTPLQTVWSILSLHQTYYLVDVLALYVLLMVAAPLALLLLCDGRTVLVLGVAWLTWAGFQLFPRQTELPWTTAGNNLFYLASWQALFFTAMVIGFHRKRLGALVPKHLHVPLLIVTGLGLAGLIVMYSNQSAALQVLQSALANVPGLPAWSVADLEDGLFAKGDVRPGRIVASAVVFGFLFLLVTVFWVPIRRSLAWLLLRLGQNALYAYSTHVVLAVILGLFSTRLVLGDNTTWLSAAIQVASIGLIWLAIRWRVLYPSPENRRLWMGSVVPLALVAAVVLRPTVSPTPGVDTTAMEGNASLQPQTSDEIRRARAFGTPIPRLAGPSAGMLAPAGAPSGLAPQPVAQPMTSQATASDDALTIASADLAGSFREVTFYSSALDRDMAYYVYLPPGYATEGRRYPVLYMLHGAGGSKDEWPAYGLVDDVDRSIVSKDINPMIVVLPQGDQGYWVDWAADGPRWGDYVARDLRHQVDATFRTLPDAAHRAIGGLSMGGAGALQLAFTHPSTFAVVGAHSPSLHVDDGTFSGIYGTGADFSAREPLDLAVSARDIETLTIWIDVGETDPWLERDELLHGALLERGIAHNYSVLPGGHDGDYWTENLPAYLHFYDSVLSGNA
jgi:enterochelin esterase-like enzyme